MEPPKYGDQGEARGRKPNKNKGKGGKGKKGKGKKKSRATAEVKSKKISRKRSTLKSTKKSKKAAVAAMEVEATEPAAESSPVAVESPEPAPKSKAKAKKRAAPVTMSTAGDTTDPAPKRRPKKVETADDHPIPEDAVDAPEGIPSNLVYSKAYGAKKKLEATIEECQNAGKLASWLLRFHGKVSPSLSGPPVYTPKGPRVRKAKDNPPKNKDGSTADEESAANELGGVEGTA